MFNVTKTVETITAAFNQLIGPDHKVSDVQFHSGTYESGSREVTVHTDGPDEFMLDLWDDGSVQWWDFHGAVSLGNVDDLSEFAQTLQDEAAKLKEFFTWSRKNGEPASATSRRKWDMVRSR